METSSLSGTNWIFAIIIFFIVAGFMNGGFGFGNGNNSVSNDFAYTNLSNQITANANAINTTDRDVLNSKYELDRDVLQNRYDMSLQTNQLQNQASVNALEMQSKLDSCCCTMRTEMANNTQKIIDTITGNRIADLEKELNLAQIVASNQTQTQNILNSLGNYYPKSGVNPYYVYGSTGTSIL